MMKTTIAAGALLFLALAGTADGYSQSRAVLIPNGNNAPLTGPVGTTHCERIGPPGLTPLHCETSGFGAFFSDIGCSRDANGNGVPDGNLGCLDDLDNIDTDNENGDDAGVDSFATGTCTVGVWSGAGTNYEFICATDRDDDGAVTSDGVRNPYEVDLHHDRSLDFTGSSDNDPGGKCNDDHIGIVPDPGHDIKETKFNGQDCYDDEWVVGNQGLDAGPDSVDFCFTRDRADYPLASNDWPDSGGDDWDEVTVFFVTNQPDVAAYVGIVEVTLNVTGATACGPDTNYARSGHDDNVYYS